MKNLEYAFWMQFHTSANYVQYQEGPIERGFTHLSLVRIRCRRYEKKSRYSHNYRLLQVNYRYYYTRLVQS